MTRFLIYLLVMGSMLYFLSWWGQRNLIPKKAEVETKPSRWFRQKRNPQEIWVQVFETGSLDEARVLQARLQEEEVECVLYEQGKKDIHGNALKGVGIAVPKTAMALAQNIISRLLS